jgi:CRP-like cAMP-binding protein
MTAATLPQSAKAASLLDLDPDLGSSIDREEWEQARQASRANVVRVGRGRWALPDSCADRDDIIGLIVIDGVFTRELALNEHVALELLCRGDVLLLPPTVSDDLGMSSGITLTALSKGRLVVLSDKFIRAAACWPSLLTNLHRRIEAQRQRLTMQGLAAHLPRAEDRLLLTLWLLANSCGRVTPEGTILPLALTHEVLARLTAARRPTITLALHALETSDCIRRRPDGHFILTVAARAKVNELTSATDAAEAIGTSIVLHKLPDRRAWDAPSVTPIPEYSILP